MRYIFSSEKSDFATYADGTLPYVEANNFDEVITILENDSTQLFQWFSDNQIKTNKDKCHLVIGNNETFFMKMDNIGIENTSSEKLLCIKIKKNLNFKEGLEGIIKKASGKVNVLSPITSYMINTVFTSQFNYCHLVWMRHNCTINTKIIRLHVRCLRIAYNDNISSIQELLDKDKGVTTYIQNVRAFAVEIFKVSNNYSTSLMSEIFDKRNNVYNFRKNPFEFATRNVRSVVNGAEIISILGLKTWDIAPSKLKRLETENAFERKIKECKPENSSCMLCGPYIENVGFLQA